MAKKSKSPKATVRPQPPPLAKTDSEPALAAQDPSRQIGYLQQCLSSDKKPLGLFLGAGCPLAIRDRNTGEPLIPDIAGMTKVIREDLERCDECGPLLATIDIHFKKDGRSDPTVEDILSHVRALRAVAGADKVRDLSAQQLDKLDDRICELIHGLADKILPGEHTPYHDVASWVGAISRMTPVELFTTNYDLLMEQAFEDHRVPYFDGFAGARRPFFDIRAMEEDALPPRWARLWKLHGSINWYQAHKKGIVRGAANENGLKRVIHPSHLKYEESRRMPYLAMVDRLRAFLKQPTATLVLCGYSFRDEHINEVLVQCLESTQNAVAFAVLFDKIGEYNAACDLAQRRSNLNLLARDGAVIGSCRAAWIQRDSDSVQSNSSVGTSWTPLDPAASNGKRLAQFLLGDFAVFGEFVSQLIGRHHVLLETSNAT